MKFLFNMSLVSGRVPNVLMVLKPIKKKERTKVPSFKLLYKIHIIVHTTSIVIIIKI